MFSHADKAPDAERSPQGTKIQEKGRLPSQNAHKGSHDPFEQISCKIGDTSCAAAHASSLRPAASPRAGSNARSIIRLQQRYGNRFVQRVLALSRDGSGNAAVSPDIEQAIQQARGNGLPLGKEIRTSMESAFRADFSGVRVHTDNRADMLNRRLNARAFTTGKDIFFRQGEHNPGSSAGRELLAHELTHVVQQNGDEVRTRLTVGAPDDRLEREADHVARSIIQQEDRRCCVQRQLEDEEEEEMQAKRYGAPAGLREYGNGEPAQGSTP